MRKLIPKIENVLESPPTLYINGYFDGKLVFLFFWDRAPIRSTATIRKKCRLLDMRGGGVSDKPALDAALNLQRMRLMSVLSLRHPNEGSQPILDPLFRPKYVVNRNRIELLIRDMGFHPNDERPLGNKGPVGLSVIAARPRIIQIQKR